jgi:hypothetical protein
MSSEIPKNPALSPNVSPTETPTASQRWTPPKGIYYELNRKRPSAPFMLRWKENDGSPKSQSFATEEDRESKAKALADVRREHGNEILNFDPREWRRWLQFKELVGDVDPLDVYREWMAGRADAGRGGGTTTVANAVSLYMAYRKEGKLAADTLRHFKKHLQDRFGAVFADSRVRDITPQAISNWLKGLTHPRTGEPMDAVTRKHHRKDVNTFFDYCVSQGWAPRNPCELVAVPAIEEEDVVLMAVDDGRRLFEKNAKERVVGRLALEAFGFLRASSAGRIQREHINFEERGIRMPGAQHKSQKTKFRQGHPDNLWEWLKRAPDDCWTMQWWEYRNEKALAFARADLSGSDNRLRKTCLSAHLAWLKNQPLTSYLAQHRHQSTTDIYLGVMLERDGQAWFQIRPPGIKPQKQGRTSPSKP